MILRLCNTYFPWVATSPWYTNAQTVWGTTTASEHMQQGINCTLHPFHLASTSSSPCPAKPLTQPPRPFVLQVSPFCLSDLEALLLLCVKLLLTALLNPSPNLIFLQWSNFFTHHISAGYTRYGDFAKNCDIFLKPIFSSLSVQKLNSSQHGGCRCDWAVTNEMAGRGGIMRFRNTHTALGEVRLQPC